MKKLQFYILFFLLIFVSQNIFSQSLRDESLAIYKGKSISIEEVLSKYLQINSISGNEKEAGDWLKNLCIENGLFIKEMGTENGNYNFSASIYPLSNQLPNVVFLNHIDVVPVGDSLSWIHKPFSGAIVDGEIWGRGAFDNKGCAVMQLFSLLEFKNKNKDVQLPFNVTFLAVSGEEIQDDGGAKHVVDHFLKEINPAVVIGEGPPGVVGFIDPDSEIPLFSISVAHKRALWLELDLNIETSGHGSVTPTAYATKEMNKALYELLKKDQKAIYTDLNVALLKQLGKVQGGFKGWVLKHPRLFKPLLVPKLRKKPELFSLFSNTITLTSIDSYSEAINVIPNQITAHLDCRLLPSESRESFLADLRKRLNNDKIEINILETMPDVACSEINSKYYTSMSKAVKSLYTESDVIVTLLPNFNDLGIFRQAGIQSYAVIPVILEKKYLESIHNINERIPVSVLSKGQEVYVNFMTNLLEEE